MTQNTTTALSGGKFTKQARQQELLTYEIPQW